MPADPRSPAESVFFGHLQSLPEGVEPGMEELCARHPELALELETLFEAYTRGASLLRRADPRAGAGPERGGPGRRYTIRREIARGGMGTILEVWDEELRRPLAMKVLRDRPGESAEILARIGSERRRSRLLNEAQILGQLDHPGIVPVIEVGRNNDEVFFTMQLVRGQNLAEIFDLVRRGEEGWTLPRAVGVILRVCEAMAYAHERGVVHRDLKPQNVMVGRFGETYVMDWGLAKARGRGDPADIRLRDVGVDPRGTGDRADGAAPRHRSVRTDRRDVSGQDSSSPLRTFDGDVVGTPAYMSPEQAAGEIESVDEFSDVYGAGAVLYHLLAGRVPYADSASTGPHDVLSAVRAGPPPPFDRKAGAIPAELAAICAKAMARERERRYQSMMALANDLRAWLEGRVVGAYRTGPVAHLVKWSARQRLAAGLLLLLLIVSASSAATLGFLYRQSEHRRRAAVIAQADSLRRQSAKLAQDRGGLPLPSFVDEFDDGRIDRRWIVTGNPNLVEEQSGQLRLTSAGADAPSVGLDPYVNRIVGDFDLEVEFELIDFSVPKVARGERIAGLRLTDLAGEQVIEVCRHAELQSATTPGTEQTWRSYYDFHPSECVEETSSVGRLRVSRRAARVSTHVWRDGWHPLLSRDGVDEDLLAALFCRDYYVESHALFAVDRLEFRSYASNQPTKPLTSLVEDFSGETLSPLLRVHGGAGALAVLDGRLSLEKLPGRVGGVIMMLDEQSDFVLRDDFDVSFRFELERFPIPERAAAHLSLRIYGKDGTSFGTVEVLGNEGKLRYKAWYHAGSAEAPLEGTEGRLRILRRGNSIRFQTWDDGWADLLERPEVNGENEMRFGIDLQTTDEEGCVVTIDDLVATSGP